MRGYIKLISKGFGKVIIGNSESAILAFPKTFEDGDRVEVEFRDKNLSQIANIIAFSKDRFYGKVIQKFNSTAAIALVSYPKLLGTILIDKNYEIGDRLEFTIEKQYSGKQRAVDIKRVDKKNYYKTELPLFGKIEEKIFYSKDGVITDIIKKRKDVKKGKIKVVKDRGFGFIKAEDGSDYFFLEKDFINFYSKRPIAHREVFFEWESTFKGDKVKRFVESDELPQDGQFVVINNKIEVPLRKYREYFKQEPQLGDIVSYIDDGDFEFAKSNTVIKKRFFKTYIDFKDKKEGVITYYNPKKHYGFIEDSDKNSYIFFEKTFRYIFNKSPQKGKKVIFDYIKTDKGYSVKHFFITTYEVKESQFKNFIKPDKDSSYYAYIDKNRLKELYLYNPNDLSQSISCFKSSNDIKNKIEAIECILNSEYESKNISKESLLKEKLKYLDNLIADALNKGRFYEAVNYEAKYQSIKFNPKRLSKLSNFSSVFLKPIQFIEDKIEFKRPDIKESYLNIIRFNALDFKSIKPLKQKDKKIAVIEDKINLKNWCYAKFIHKC